jgi:hypothetical protein
MHFIGAFSALLGEGLVCSFCAYDCCVPGRFCGFEGGTHFELFIVSLYKYASLLKRCIYCWSRTPVGILKHINNIFMILLNDMRTFECTHDHIPS